MILPRTAAFLSEPQDPPHPAFCHLTQGEGLRRKSDTLLGKLLAGDMPTLQLLQTNPFPEAPPRYIRALYYQYRFTTPAERRQSGHWWQRELIGAYFPPVSLEDAEIRSLLGRIEGEEM